MERSTWFRKQHRAIVEAANVDSHPSRTDADPPEPRKPSPVAIHGSPQAEPSKLAFAAPNFLTELRLWNDEIARFKPDPRRLARNLVIGPGAPRDIRSAYNLVRTEALKRLRQNRWNTVAVTSPSRGSGNTLTALNLAISIARDLTQTVLLVELDLIAPSLQSILGFGPRQGVANYLLDDAPLSEILLDIGVERLAIIPAGSPVRNSSELLSSPRMAQFVEELKRCYGRLTVLFDLPSVLAFDDAMAFAALVDCVLLVVEEGETRVDDVKRALSHVRPANILGIVVNRSVRGENEIGAISR